MPSNLQDTVAAATAARERQYRQAMIRKSRDTLAPWRRLLLAAVTAYYLFKVFFRQLYPWGGSVVWPGRQAYGSIDTTNTEALGQQRVLKIFDNAANDDNATSRKSRIKGTETIVVDPTAKGTIYAMTEEAKLIRVSNVANDSYGNTATATIEVVHDLGNGRPLGGAFTADGQTLWIADAALGLMRLRNPTNPQSKVELVVSSVVTNDDDDDGSSSSKVSKLAYTNDVTIGPQTGKVYFTDASTVVPTRVKTRTWDTLYAAKVDMLRGVPSGRLLVYDPATDEVQVLATGLRFANGISVNGNDESYLLIGETFGMRIWKYHLKGPQAGEMEVLVSHLPGYVDGLSCSTTEGGGRQCFAVLQTLVVPIHKLLAAVPDFVDVWLRYVLLALPRSLAPVGTLVFRMYLLCEIFSFFSIHFFFMYAWHRKSIP